MATLAYCILIVDPSGGTPSNINVIYTSLKSTFSGLQFCRWQYAKTRGKGLLHGENCIILNSTVFDWSTCVTHRQTDGW